MAKTRAVKMGLEKYDPKKTFEQFISEDVLKKVKTNKNKLTFGEMNVHWRPSNTYCAFCNIDYALVSKMETFEEDKERILEILGVKARKKGQRLNIHAGNKVQHQTRQLFKNISVQNKAALYGIYKYDFQMFEYDHNL